MPVRGVVGGFRLVVRLQDWPGAGPHLEAGLCNLSTGLRVPAGRASAAQPRYRRDAGCFPFRENDSLNHGSMLVLLLVFCLIGLIYLNRFLYLRCMLLESQVSLFTALSFSNSF